MLGFEQASLVESGVTKMPPGKSTPSQIESGKETSAKKEGTRGPTPKGSRKAITPVMMSSPSPILTSAHEEEENWEREGGGAIGKEKDEKEGEIKADAVLREFPVNSDETEEEEEDKGDGDSLGGQDYLDNEDLGTKEEDENDDEEGSYEDQAGETQEDDDDDDEGGGVSVDRVREEGDEEEVDDADEDDHDDDESGFFKKVFNVEEEKDLDGAHFVGPFLQRR